MNLSLLLYEQRCCFTLISETWLLLNSHFSLPNFHIIESNRFDEYGGVIIATYHSIQISILPIEPSLNVSLQSYSIDLLGVIAFINGKYLLKL